MLWTIPFSIVSLVCDGIREEDAQKIKINMTSQ